MKKQLSLWLVPAAEGEPTIANYLSLCTTATLEVWALQHVSACASTCVSAFEIGRLANCWFCVSVRRGEGRAEICWVTLKGHEVKADYYVFWQLEIKWDPRKPQTSSAFNAHDRFFWWPGRVWRSKAKVLQTEASQDRWLITYEKHVTDYQWRACINFESWLALHLLGIPFKGHTGLVLH